MLGYGDKGVLRRLNLMADILCSGPHKPFLILAMETRSSAV